MEREKGSICDGTMDKSTASDLIQLNLMFMVTSVSTLKVLKDKVNLK